MIEREFIKEKAKHLKIKEYIESKVSQGAGTGKIAIEKTPLGEKITISAVRPGLIIGRGGQAISELTNVLKEKFKLENPQIEVKEIPVPQLQATVVSRKIASDLERYGPSRFKAIGHKALQDAMNAGALGVEVRIGGRGVPGQKAKSWLFSAGLMKKCGNTATEVDFSIARADLRSGTVGIQVRIMHPDINLPDKVTIKEPKAEVKPEVKVEIKQETVAPKVEIKKKEKEEQPQVESKKKEEEQKKVSAIEKTPLKKKSKIETTPEKAAEQKAEPKIEAGKEKSGKTKAKVAEQEASN